MFLKPEVLPADEVDVRASLSLVRNRPSTDSGRYVQLEWKNPDVNGLVQFLVTEKGFK